MDWFYFVNWNAYLTVKKKDVNIVRLCCWIISCWEKLDVCLNINKTHHADTDMWLDQTE